MTNFVKSPRIGLDDLSSNRLARLLSRSSFIFRNSKDSTNGSVSENASNARPLSIEGPRVNNEGQQQTRQQMPNQPRQPTNLQGLLRFAMEATSAEDAPHASHVQPLDEEVNYAINFAVAKVLAAFNFYCISFCVFRVCCLIFCPMHVQGESSDKRMLGQAANE